MEPQVGSILEGKVTTITKFGAFVALGNGKSGLVHISEIANAFVNDVHDFLQEGQTVKVLVLSTENGKINLSIKKALPQQERPAPRGPRPMTQRPAARPAGGPPRHARSPQQTLPPSADQSFEALQNTSVVVASYDIGGDMRGLIGVVGPTRMDYASVAARLAGFADGLTRMFGKQEGLPPEEDTKT